MESDWKDFLAGWMGGIASIIASHPFDTIKMYQQINDTRLLTSIRNLFLAEGIRGFYKGSAVPMVAFGPSNATFFGVYGACIRIMQNTKDSNVLTSRQNWRETVFKAGVIAGTAQVMVTTPAELVKTALQMSVYNKQIFDFPRYKILPVPRTMLFIMSSIYSKYGIKGVYTGFIPTLWRDAPISGPYILSYEMLTAHKYGYSFLNHDIIRQLIAGSVAGFIAWFPVMPFDVVKSKVTADRFRPQKRYKGMTDCFIQTYKQHGIGVFFSGTSAVVARACICNAVMFVTYEHFLILLQ